MQIEYLKTSSIKPYEKNAKKHDKKCEILCSFDIKRKYKKRVGD